MKTASPIVISKVSNGFIVEYPSSLIPDDYDARRDIKVFECLDALTGFLSTHFSESKAVSSGDINIKSPVAESLINAINENRVSINKQIDAVLEENELKRIIEDAYLRGFAVGQSNPDMVIKTQHHEYAIDEIIRIIKETSEAGDE